MEKKKKSQKKVSKKENKVKVFLNNHKLFKILFVTFSIYVIARIFLYFMSIELAKLEIPRSYYIACLEVDMHIDRKKQNYYCKCKTDVMERYLKSLNVFLFFDKIKDNTFIKQFNETANKNCIHLFYGNIEKDDRVVSVDEMKVVQNNFKKSFMDSCLRTSGRKEFCECGLNESLSFMTEDKWKIIYFGEKENSTESDKQKYADFFVRYVDNVKLGATKCLKKFPKTKK